MAEVREEREVGRLKDFQGFRVFCVFGGLIPFVCFV
jgi:hypothetical protein